MRHLIPSDLKDLLYSGLWRSIGSLAIKIAAAGLTYIGFVLIARVLSPEEYGYFAFGIALATILAIGGGLGQQVAILRVWPEQVTRGDSGRAETALRAGGILTIGASLMLGLGLALLSLGVAWLWPQAGPVNHLYATALLILPLALAEYNSAALRIQGSILAALVPRDIVWRVSLPLAALGLGLGTGWAMLVAAALLLGLALGLQYFWSAWRHYRLAPNPAGIGQYWRARGGLSLWLLLGIAIETISLNLDTVLVGLFRDAADAGTYFNAARTAGLMTLLMYASTLVIGPMLSRHYHAGDRRRTQAVAAVSAWSGFAFSLLVLAAFAVFGRQILGLFGPGYEDGWLLLVILGFGFLFDAATGSSRTTMMMTGHERAYVLIAGICTLAGLFAQLFVIPLHGLVGAATITTISRILTQIAIGLYCAWRIGIDPTILGLFRLPSSQEGQA